MVNRVLVQSFGSWVSLWKALWFPRGPRATSPVYHIFFIMAFFFMKYVEAAFLEMDGHIIKGKDRKDDSLESD